METPQFLRPAGERAKAVPYANSQEEHDPTYKPPGKFWDSLRHGDIVYYQEGYRGMETFVVTEFPGQKRDAVNLCDGAGYAEIPKDVARYIEDPLTFYHDVTDEHLYQGVTTIVFDPEVHAKMLEAATGNKNATYSRGVYWATYEEGFISGDAAVEFL